MFIGEKEILNRIKLWGLETPCVKSHLLRHWGLCWAVSKSKSLLITMGGKEENLPNKNFRWNHIIGVPLDSNQRRTWFLKRLWIQISQLCRPSVLDLLWWGCDVMKSPPFVAVCYDAMFLDGRGSTLGPLSKSTQIRISFSLACSEASPWEECLWEGPAVYTLTFLCPNHEPSTWWCAVELVPKEMVRLWELDPCECMNLLIGKGLQRVL